MTPSLVHHLLERSAAVHPDRVAVVDGARSATYAELEASANRLAHRLLSLGVSKGDRVGIYLDKSMEAVVGVYGVLKAGAAYVPLDPGSPPSRLVLILRDCGVRCLLTATSKAGTWPDLVAGGAPVEHFVVLGPDEDDAEADAGRPPLPGDGSELAYILYTSGSSGSPKGVMLTHRNCLAFVEWAVGQFAVGPDDRLSNHAPLHFDLSTFDLFASAAAGAAVVLVPPSTSVFASEIARFIETNEITVWYSVPSVLNLLAHTGLEPGRLSRLRTVLFAGEVFPTPYLRRLMATLPRARFANLYGPTETNVCTWHDVPRRPEHPTEPIPLGKAIAGVEVFAVTDDGRVAGTAEEGELWVRGPTVMQGYWGDAERTGRSLVPSPCAEHQGDLAYRTGDMAVRDEVGNWHFRGRRDLQVKSRGYRIELGEIEAALYANPAVVECAVLAVPDEMVSNRITASVVVAGGVSTAELARFCRERLPRHMVPETFELLAELPKTSTGKVDRQALGAVNQVAPAFIRLAE